MKGIDVSEWQGTIDWRKVKDSGVQFALLRSSLTHQNRFELADDDSFRTNVLEAYKNDIHIGAYHYSCAKTIEQGREEAKYFIEKLKPYFGMLDMPVFLDIEDPKQWALSDETLIGICKVWGEEVEKAGYYFGIYSSLNYMDRLNVSELERYDRWLAQLYDHPTYKGDFGIWQYSWKGKVPGINANVDLDISYKDYPTIIYEAGLNGLQRKPVPPEPDPNPDPVQYHKGDIVRILPNATWWGGQEISSWAYEHDWIVYEGSIANRVVINKSTDGQFAIMSPIDEKYLEKVGSKPPKPVPTPGETLYPDDTIEVSRQYDDDLSARYRVTKDTYLRARSSEKSHAKAVLKKDSEVICYGYHNGDWYAVVNAQGIDGYVHSKYLR